MVRTFELMVGLLFDKARYVHFAAVYYLLLWFTILAGETTLRILG